MGGSELPSYRGTVSAAGSAVGRNPLTRLLLWCSGTDPRHILIVPERYRFAGYGFLIVLVAGVSGALCTMFVAVITGGYRPWMLAFAGIWSLLIFWLDRSIMGEPRYGSLAAVRSSEQGAARRSRRWSGTFVKYALRLVIALAMGVIMAEVALLLVYRSEITEELAAANARAAPKTVVVDNSTILALQKDIADNEKRRQDAQDLVDKAQAAADAESKGTGGTGRAGDGPRWQQRMEELASAQHERDRINAEVADANPKYQAKIDEERATQLDAQSVLRRARQDDRGWIRQEEALHAFLGSTDSRIARMLPWVLRLVFVAIDLLPVSLKLFSGPTVYELSVREEAEVAAYQRRRERQAAEDEIDHRMEMRALTRGVEGDIERERQHLKRVRGLWFFKLKGW